MSRRIGVLTAGGDAPGQNVCLKTIVYNAVDRGYDVIGLRRGWEGLLQFDPANVATHASNAMELTKPRVRDIDRTTGSYLHSSRVNPASVAPQAVPPFLRGAAPSRQPVDLTQHVKRAFAALGLEALILLGDNNSLHYAARLSTEGVPILGVPKSVHNDVNGSDYCLGFSSALAQGVRLIHDLRSMAASREEVAVAEMFGRESGLTTLLIGFLAGCDRILIPEVPCDLNRLAGLLQEDKGTNPANYAVLATSEAVTFDHQAGPGPGDELTLRALARRTLPSNAQTGQHTPLELTEAGLTLGGDRAIGLGAAGAGAVITEILENRMQERLLYQPLSYLLRAGQPDGQDLLGATNFGQMAVNLLSSGKTGRLVAYRRGENYVDLPLEVVAGQDQNVNSALFYDSASFRAQPEVLWATRI